MHQTVTIDIVDSDEDSDDDDEVQFSGSITSQVSSNGRAVSSKRRGVASRRKISQKSPKTQRRARQLCHQRQRAQAMVPKTR